MAWPWPGEDKTLRRPLGMRDCTVQVYTVQYKCTLYRRRQNTEKTPGNERLRPGERASADWNFDKLIVEEVEETFVGTLTSARRSIMCWLYKLISDAASDTIW